MSYMRLCHQKKVILKRVVMSRNQKGKSHQPRSEKWNSSGDMLSKPFLQDATMTQWIVQVVN
jgi:hypothetical protein